MCSQTKIVFVQVSRLEPSALPDYGPADLAPADYNAADRALPEPKRRLAEAVEVRRLPEQAA